MGLFVAPFILLFSVLGYMDTRWGAYIPGWAGGLVAFLKERRGVYTDS